MAQLNFFKSRPAYGWGPGVTQRRHIADIYGKNPIKFAQAAYLTWGANYGASMMSLLKNHTQVREFDSDDEYTWDLYGNTWKNYALLEARDMDGTVITSSYPTNVGAGGEFFQLVFGEQPFAYGEMIVGEMNEFYQFKIVEEPISEGSNTVYTVQLMAGAEEGCPVERLQMGEKFSHEFDPVESELSRKVGGIRKAIGTKMRNEWTTIRKYMKFTGRANKQLRLDVDLPMYDPDSGEKKVAKSWFDNELWIFNNEWQRSKNRAYIYSRSNRNSNGTYYNHGDSGNVIKEGDGIMAQMLYGNTYFYNGFNENFSIKGLADAIYELCEANNVPLSERKFAVMTGSRGMIQVNEAIKKETSGFGMNNMEYSGNELGIVTKTSSPVHQTALAYGAQFVEYRAANGLVLTFFLEPSLDDRERNKITGPNGKGVLQSYAYYIFDLGSSAEPNMYLTKITDEDEAFKYILGVRNPFGIKNENVISHDEDSSEIHIPPFSLGAVIVDPTRCLSYLPTGLVA